MNPEYIIPGFIACAALFCLLTKTAKPGHENERGFHTDYDEED